MDCYRKRIRESDEDPLESYILYLIPPIPIWGKSKLQKNILYMSFYLS